MLPAKLLDDFLRSNKSNINQCEAMIMIIFMYFIFFCYLLFLFLILFFRQSYLLICLLIYFIMYGFCSKQTCVFSGIQFTRHLIEFVVVETKQIVSINSNLYLMQQICGQRLGMAAVSRRRASACIFPDEFAICS